ncbi:non-ribosomal peptide synthetase [Corynebacterium diphtheriae]|nr:non-ribosomal peptide synthetase [Corynebacterium diphtheriae]
MNTTTTTDTITEILTAIYGPVDPQQSLSHLGIDSMTAVRLQREIHHATGIYLPLITFLGDATVATLARAVDNAEPAALETSTRTIPTNGRTMTPVQATYWVGRQPDYALGGIATRFYMEHDITIDGPMDEWIDALRRSWNTVVQRHGMLRATVDRDGKISIADTVTEHPLPVHNADHAAEVRERLAHRTADLGTWPVHDIELTTITATTVRIHCGFDVILIDYPSIMRVLNDWGRALAGYDLGTEDTSFSDLIAQGIAEPRPSDEAYWRERAPRLLPGPLDLAEMTYDAATTPEFHRHTRTIAAQQWKQFVDNAHAHGTNASSALLAVAAHSLRHVGPRRSFTLGATFFSPDVLEHGPVGDFTRTGVVELPDTADTFAQQASAAQHELWEAFDHASVTSADIMRWRNSDTTGQALPDYPVVFTSALGHGDSTDWPGVMTWGVSQTPQVLMDLLHWESDGDLVLAWDCVDAALPENFADNAIDIAYAVIQQLTNPAVWTDPTVVADPWLRMPEPMERIGESELIDAPLRAQYEAAPEARAVIAGEQSWTRAELDHHSERLAAAVARAAHDHDVVRADAPVLVMMQKSCMQVAAVCAVVRAGLAYIPVDPSWPMERVQSVMQRSGAVVCLADESVAIPEGLHRIPLSEQGAEATGYTGRQPQPEDLAYVIFTSGSTGQPKGVAIEHRAARTTIDDVNQRFEITDTDVVLGLSALSFDLSVWDIFGGLGAGATVVLPEEDRLRDPSYWLDLCDRHEITVWNSAPPLLEMLVDYAEIDPEAAAHALRNLRMVMLSGDWIPVTLPRRLKELAPNATVMSLGGATEASIWSICHRTSDADEHGPSIPYGRALRGQWFRILDTEGVPVPLGTPGILHIGGHGVARGYLGDPERTAERFCEHPRLGERLYNTGDEGMWLPNGEIRFLGRVDRQVKINGFRIELGEVDAALARCASVKSAISAAPQDASGRKRLLGHVVPTQPERFDDSVLRRELAEHLPSYMIPSRFVVHDHLPVTDNGKVDHKALPNPWSAETAPEPQVEPEPEVLPEPDRGSATPTELGINSLDIVRLANRIEDATGTRPSLATLLNQPWQESLAMVEVLEPRPALASEQKPELVPDRDREVTDVVGAGMALGARIRAEIPISEEPIEDQFVQVGQWLKQLRAVVEAAGCMQVTPPSGNILCAIDITPSEKADVPDHAPLTPLQLGYLVGRADTWLGETVTPHYYTEVEVADLDVVALQRALDEVVRAHPALMLGVSDDGNQGLSEALRPRLVVTDLRDHSDPDGELECIRAVGCAGVSDPLGTAWFQLRATLLPTAVRLHLSIDMLFCDVVGAGVLVSDLQRAYNGETLEPEQRGFLEFAQRVAQNSGAQVTAGASDAQPLPSVIGPWQQPTSARFERIRTEITSDVADELSRAAATMGVTLDALMATIISTTAGAITGSPAQPIVATVLARPRGFERTVGEFTSTVRVVPDQGDFVARAKSATHTLVTATDRALRCESEPRQGSVEVTPIVYSSGLHAVGDQSEVLGTWGKTIVAQSWTPQVLVDVQLFRTESGLALIVDYAVDALQPGAGRAFADGIVAAMRQCAMGAGMDSIWPQLRVPGLRAVDTRWTAFDGDSAPSSTKPDHLIEVDIVAHELGSVLGITLEAQSYDKGFFDVGASSVDLIAMRNALVSRGYSLTLLDVFAHPSVLQLGRFIAPDTPTTSQVTTDSAHQRGHRRRRIARALNGELS